MKRLAIVLLLLALAALIAGVAWFALVEPSAPPRAVEAETPTGATMNREEETIQRHRDIRDNSLDSVIAELKVPGETPEYRPLLHMQAEQWMKIKEATMTCVLENPTFRQIVAEAQKQIGEKTGVKVYFYEGGDFPDDYPWGDIVLRDQTIDHLLQMLLEKSANQCKHYITDLGLVIGTEGAVEQAQMDWNASTATLRSAADSTLAIMQTEYRPDFDRSMISAVVRQIRDQTGIEVVADSDVWTKPKVITWRSKPVTLATALDRICKVWGAYYRVKDGRVFLLQP